MRALVLSALMLTLSSCMGFDKGNGLDRLDTETKEEKAEQRWFDKYYGGKENCDDSFWSTTKFCPHDD